MAKKESKRKKYKSKYPDGKWFSLHYFVDGISLCERVQYSGATFKKRDARYNDPKNHNRCLVCESEYKQRRKDERAKSKANVG